MNKYLGLGAVALVLAAVTGCYGDDDGKFLATTTYSIQRDDAGNAIGIVETLDQTGETRVVESFPQEGQTTAAILSQDPEGMVLWRRNVNVDVRGSDDVSASATLLFYHPTSHGLRLARHDFGDALQSNHVATYANPSASVLVIVENLEGQQPQVPATAHAELIGANGVLWRGPEVEVPSVALMYAVEWDGAGDAQVSFAYIGGSNVTVGVPTAH